jgi:hypothetical protein
VTVTNQLPLGQLKNRPFESFRSNLSEHAEASHVQKIPRAATVSLAVFQLLFGDDVGFRVVCEVEELRKSAAAL